MSYCRFNDDCDLYVICNSREDQVFLCCGCKLGGQELFRGYQAIMEHIFGHEIAGHKVPTYLIPWLQSEKDNPPSSILSHLPPGSAVWIDGWVWHTMSPCKLEIKQINPPPTTKIQNDWGDFWEGKE